MRKNVLITSVIAGLVALAIAIIAGLYINKAACLDNGLKLASPKTKFEEQSVQEDKEESAVETSVDVDELQDENVTSLLEDGGTSPLDIDIDKLDLGAETENLDFNESDLNDLDIDEESNISNEFNI